MCLSHLYHHLIIYNVHTQAFMLFFVVSDVSVMDGDSEEIKEHLRLQFQTLQEQQVQRIRRRLEMKRTDTEKTSPLSSLDNINLMEEDGDVMDLFNAR